MLRVFSTPAPESSQFILKLQFSDPCRAPAQLFVPLHTETPIKKYILLRGRHDAQEFQKCQNRKIYDFQKQINVFGPKLG